MKKLKNIDAVTELRKAVIIIKAPEISYLSHLVFLENFEEAANQLFTKIRIKNPLAEQVDL